MMKMLVNLFPGLAPWLPQLDKTEVMYVFLLGVMAGVLLLTAILLLWTLIWMIFRRNKKIQGVTLSAPHGSVFISSHAVEDLIQGLEKEFPELEIERVRLQEIKKELSVQVKVNFNPHGKNMLVVADDFQQKSLDLLKNSFGIETVQKINLIVPRGYPQQ